MSRTITGLFIPANPFRAATLGQYPLDADEDCPQFEPIRQQIGCHWIEIIYSAVADSKEYNFAGVPTFVDRGELVALGDEEARNQPYCVSNGRATSLLGYPYPIVGDVVLFAIDPETGCIESLPSDLLAGLAVVDERTPSH